MSIALIFVIFALAILILATVKMPRLWPAALLAEVAHRASTRGYHPFPPTPGISIGLLGLSAVLGSTRLGRVIHFDTLKLGHPHRLVARVLGAMIVVLVVLVYLLCLADVIWPTPFEEVSGRVRLLYALESAVCPNCQSGVLVAWFFMSCLIAFPIWVRWNRNRYFRWDERAGLYIPTDRARRKWGIRR